MHPFLRKVLLRPHRAAALALGYQNLESLRAHPHPSVQRVAAACLRAMASRFSPEEQEPIDRIEALRARASLSQVRILVDDFGAVSPKANLTHDQMYRGRVVERTVAETCHASKGPVWTALLFHLVRALRPVRGVELGCCVGISAAYQAEAMRLNGDGGHLWTLEGAGAVADVAQRHFQELGLDGITVVVGRFEDTLAGVLQRCGPIDYAFIDGHHDERATLRYFEQILDHCQPQALLLFDDIDWSAGMKRAWRALMDDARVPLAIDCGEIGLCLLDATLRERIRIRAPLW